jgi:hypothetical protein
MEDKIYNLVKEQFEKMEMSEKYSNQAKLSNICQEIIYNDWGVGNDSIWAIVDTYVKQFIPDELD